MIFDEGFVTGGEIDAWSSVNEVCKKANEGYRVQLGKSKLLE